MGTRARRFFARFNRLELSAPLVQASSGHPELLGQLIDAFTALHPLYGHALKLPGISLSSLHCYFLSRRVCPSRLCQFKGSFHLFQAPNRLQRSCKLLLGFACGLPTSPNPSVESRKRGAQIHNLELELSVNPGIDSRVKCEY